jgi:hypothetical protein
MNKTETLPQKKDQLTKELLQAEGMLQIAADKAAFNPTPGNIEWFGELSEAVEKIRQKLDDVTIRANVLEVLFANKYRWN